MFPKNITQKTENGQEKSVSKDKKWANMNKQWLEGVKKMSIIYMENNLSIDNIE